ncbi:hypothetical protein SYNTR_1446 [Candidatus Syntrophocurvum alkaliphilum]|uniref:Peptidase M50 domain-containing protein n=1 Tax=Candidatus Syntrophocurvum alkaliphilum TaxID=2293317 RepID=A0A6I6DCU3_9FIRM|nr:M50 family metallopeptidase [Candidatus Syntrophocurvum alkaliphilum]QGU00040.1 hypothetical protein SYNTR_1446 [Candidatus Syntrophocurvum alkaliphilum]
MKLASIAGITFKINPVLLFLCILYGLLGLLIEVFIIFSAVIIHELAHIIVAKLMGIKVIEVELFPFGGQAKIESFMGLDPEKEIYVALAGPIISLSLAGILYFLNPSINSTYLSLLVKINALLGIFNLIPIIPLDGGKVVRALLSTLIGYKKATEWLSLLGKVFALALIGYGSYQTYFHNTGINFIVLGVFLFWAAHREGKLLAYAFMRFLVNKKQDLSKNGYLPARQIVSNYDVTVKQLLNNTRPNFYLIVVVIDDNHQVVAMKTEAELIELLLTKGPNLKLGDC